MSNDHPLIQSFRRFENAHARAWTLDTEDSCLDKDRKATKEAWEQSNARRSEFLNMLELAIK